MSEGEPRRRLHERAAAVAEIGALVDALRGGSGGALLLVGDAGLGKSTLLEEARYAAGEDVTVFAARAGRMETDLPFGLVGHVLPALPDARPGLNPAAARTAVWVAARELLAASAAQRPVLLLLDDLHWADADSLELLAYLVRRVVPLRVGVVATLRRWPTAAAEVAATLVADDVAVAVELEPLSPDGAAALLTDAGGTGVTRPPGPETAARAWELAGGNPLLLHQLAAVVRTEGALPDPAGLDLGRLRRVLLLSAFAALPDSVLSYARAAAVLGGEVRAALVPEVAGLDPDDAAAALDVLVDNGLLGETRRGVVAFAHPLLAHAVQEDLTPGHRTRLHHRAHRCLTRLGELAGAAQHAVAADLVGDAEAVATVRAAAAASTAAGAVRTAVHQLESAVVLCAGAVPGSLHLELADAQLAAGWAGEAATSYRAALAGEDLDPTQRGRGLRALSRALAYDGDLRGSAEAGAAAVRAGTGSVGVTALAEALVEHVHAVWQAEGPRAAAVLLSAHPSTPGEPADLAAARAFVGYHATADPGALDRLTALLEAAPGPDRISPFDPLLTYTGLARLFECFDEHDRVEGAARAAAAARGMVHAGVALDLSCFDGLIRRGRLDEAACLLDRVEADPQVGRLLAEILGPARAALLCDQGRLDEAAAALDGCGGAVMWMSRLSVAHLRARVLLEGGHIVAAAEAYRDTEELADALGVVDPCLVPWGGRAVEAHLGAGRYGDAERVCRRLEAVAVGLPAPWPRMDALAARAALAGAASDVDTADAAFAAAVALPVALPLERARVLAAQGAWLRRTNRARAARAPLAEALALAESAGAAALAARAAAELHVAGGRRRPPRSPAGELTPQQARVAELAAGGLTTREIAQRLTVSAKTVETHLTHVYRALGVRSRRELRDRPPSTP